MRTDRDGVPLASVDAEDAAQRFAEDEVAKAPFDDDDLDAARAGFTQGGSPADARRYAGQLRAKAAAHCVYAERLDSHADAVYRMAAQKDGGSP